MTRPDMARGMPSKADIVTALEEAGRPLHAGQLATRCEVSQKAYPKFLEALETMAERNQIRRLSGHRFAANPVKETPKASDQWEGVLALPVIGTLDSSRTQVVMENLLQRIVETGAVIAIIDITGVPTVDTLTAQHLLKTVAAARLMGADCIISGIRPQIAQTIVHLGVDLGSVVTKATLADAFTIALRRLGLGVTRVGAAKKRIEPEAQNRGDERAGD